MAVLILQPPVIPQAVTSRKESSSWHTWHILLSLDPWLHPQATPSPPSGKFPGLPALNCLPPPSPARGDVGGNPDDAYSSLASFALCALTVAVAAVDAGAGGTTIESSCCCSAAGSMSPPLPIPCSRPARATTSETALSPPCSSCFASSASSSDCSDSSPNSEIAPLSGVPSICIGVLGPSSAS